MRFFLSLALILCLCALQTYGRPQEIPREFRNINLENYLRNARAVQFQIKCVVYNGPCDTIGKYLKTHLPTWLKTQCANCNDEQKQHAGKFINFFQKNYPKEWDDAITKFGKTRFTDEEIARFEQELGVKLVRDQNAPTIAPGQKPDHGELVQLAKEAKEALKTTKEPIVLIKDGSTTEVTITADKLN